MLGSFFILPPQSSSKLQTPIQTELPIHIRGASTQFQLPKSMASANQKNDSAQRSSAPPRAPTCYMDMYAVHVFRWGSDP